MDTTFEEMRQQMAILKEKLEKQEIVNDHILRQSMKKNASSILNRYHFISFLCLLMIPYSYWVFLKLSHFSMAFWIGTCVLMLICMIYTLYNGKDLYGSSLFEKDLMESQHLVARAKKLDSDWLMVGIPLLFIWMGWLVYEVHHLGNENTTAMFFGVISGAAIGLFIGLKVHFKTQRQYQEIIEQIDQLKMETT